MKQSQKDHSSVVFLTNIPAPYREQIHEKVSNNLTGDYKVVYCSELEPNRQWKFAFGTYGKEFLKKSFLTYKGRYIHFNLDILKVLNRLNPQVVIAAGSFNPTMLLSFAWAKIMRRQFIPFTDGWLKSEESLSFVHRLVRKVVYRFSDAYLGASRHSFELYASYGVAREKIFQSHLCIENSRFAPHDIKKEYDLLFSGQFIDRKQPLFFAEVAKGVKQSRGSCSVLILGDGPLKEEFQEALQQAGVAAIFAGYISQDELPEKYQKAKLFLFPTLQDPWGVVANEALASGVPVITCDNAGVANELVIDGENGAVLSLDIEKWVTTVVELLDNPKQYQKLSEKSLESVQTYTYKAASDGIIKAVEYALREKK